VECALWKPRGGLLERLYNYFLDSTSHLKHQELVHSSEDRFDLFTETAGLVHFRFDILTRGFRNSGVVLYGPVS